MRNVARLRRAEAALPDAVLWIEALQIASETGERAEDIFEQGRRLAAKYEMYGVNNGDGTINIEPMLHAIALDEGLDYDLLLATAKQTIQRLGAPIKRRMRNQ